MNVVQILFTKMKGNLHFISIINMIYILLKSNESTVVANLVSNVLLAWGKPCTRF